jgi:hypothetical protein
MKTKHVSNESEEKLIKSFFGIKDTIEEIRTVARQFPSALGALSTIEAYELLNELIDLVKFIRQQGTSLLPALNPQTKEIMENHYLNGELVRSRVGSRQTNVGGIIKIFFPRVEVPWTESEQKLLDSIQFAVITAKRYFSRKMFPDLSLSVEVDHLLKKEKTRRKKRHFAQLRRKR